MTQAATLTVAVPVDLCFLVAQSSYSDPRWQQAYSVLRPGRRYSGRVTILVPDRQFEVSLAAIEPITGARLRALGHRVTYTFTPSDAGRTTVRVESRYSLLAALAGMGTLGPQVQNEVLHRLAGILALEAGVLKRAAV